jgi:hypothetical protein
LRYYLSKKHDFKDDGCMINFIKNIGSPNWVSVTEWKEKTKL